jgi:hypothetical protein
MKIFVMRLLEDNRSMSSVEVQNAIKNEFGTTISNTVINDFRRDNDLSWICPKISDHNPSRESGAAEIAVALALGTGLIAVITDTIGQCVQKKREFETFKQSAAIPKDHPDLRSKGRFTAEYNKLPPVR